MGEILVDANTITLPKVLSVSTELPANCEIVSGSSSNELAKIGGMTPAVLILSGRCERSACIIPRWVARLGYWISNRRWARSMKEMSRIRITTIAMKPMMMVGRGSSRCARLRTGFVAKVGNCATNTGHDDQRHAIADTRG